MPHPTSSRIPGPSLVVAVGFQRRRSPTATQHSQSTAGDELEHRPGSAHLSLLKAQGVMALIRSAWQQKTGGDQVWVVYVAASRCQTTQ